MDVFRGLTNPKAGSTQPEVSLGAVRSGLHSRFGKTIEETRIMIVAEPSALRQSLVDAIAREHDLAVVSIAVNEHDALIEHRTACPDVVLMDIDKFHNFGFQTVSSLLKNNPLLAVVLISDQFREKADLARQARAHGAMDLLFMPQARTRLEIEKFQHETLTRARLFGARAANLRKLRLQRKSSTSGGKSTIRTESNAPTENRPSEPKLRRFRPGKPRVLAIGSSTGGPVALSTIFAELGETIDTIPVLVTQHLPEEFASLLAQQIQRSSGRRAKVAQEGDLLTPGTVLLSPGDRHMGIQEDTAGTHRIHLIDQPPINFCVPSLEPMLETLATCFGSLVLAAILTGMGNDGAKGACKLADGGSNVLAQDEASSVVWGMPRAAAYAGACYSVMDLTKIASEISHIVQTGQTTVPNPLRTLHLQPKMKV